MISQDFQKRLTTIVQQPLNKKRFFAVVVSAYSLIPCMIYGGSADSDVRTVARSYASKKVSASSDVSSQPDLQSPHADLKKQAKRKIKPVKSKVKPSAPLKTKGPLHGVSPKKSTATQAVLTQSSLYQEKTAALKAAQAKERQATAKLAAEKAKESTIASQQSAALTQETRDHINETTGTQQIIPVVQRLQAQQKAAADSVAKSTQTLSQAQANVKDIQDKLNVLSSKIATELKSGSQDSKTLAQDWVTQEKLNSTLTTATQKLARAYEALESDERTLSQLNQSLPFQQVPITDDVVN